MRPFLDFHEAYVLYIPTTSRVIDRYVDVTDAKLGHASTIVAKLQVLVFIGLGSTHLFAPLLSRKDRSNASMSSKPRNNEITT